MALIDMVSEMTDLVPALNRIRARKLINRAFKIAQDSMIWSFQLQQGGFSTPNISTGGSVTCALNSNQVIGDAAATAQWLALPFYWSPTVQQWRAQGYSIYSVIAYDDGQTPAQGNYPFATLTLDRPFVDPLPFFSGVAYQMYQSYIPTPKGFKRWLTVADMFDQWTMDIWMSRRTEDLLDPARQIASNPWAMLALGADRRGAGTPNASATLGQQLYEMYPYPTTEIAYQWWAAVEWPYLMNNSDCLPPQLDEEVIVEKALTWAYRDAESRKDVMAAKGSGANYLALKKDTDASFLARLKTLRLLDRDAVDSYMIDMRAATRGFSTGPFFNSANMRTGMGY